MMTTHEFNTTTKNSNFNTSKITFAKRRMSRQSNENFNNIDFEYIGNTAEVNHLIRQRIGEQPNFQKLNFECNLRRYKSEGKFKGEEPWIYPKTKAFKQISIQVDKGTFPSLPSILQSKNKFNL